MSHTESRPYSGQIFPDAAVVQLQDDFARFASGLRARDPALQDDLIQEMCLGVLQCDTPHTLAYFRTRGLSRAKDYLKSWNRKSCRDWGEIRNWPVFNQNNGIENEERRIQLERIAEILSAEKGHLNDLFALRKTCA
jgi:DNA-directed RNA polymerase specialized sigma24 family protein